MKASRTVFVVFSAAAVFLLSALPVFASAAAEGEGPWTTSMHVWRIINTIALIALLIYFLKPPLMTFLSERKTQIRRDLEESKIQREKAELLIADYQAKIAGMEAELESMRSELRKTADSESRKVLANADRMAAAMIESAKIAAEQEVRKAKDALKQEAVVLAVDIAESLIREKINEDDRKRIVEDYLVKVGGMK